MKFKLLLLVFVLNITAAFAQRSGNLTFYSNTGKKFFVVLNGVRQNMEAETNVSISGLTEAWYSCRILAEDKSFDVEKNVGVKKDSVITYRILQKRKKYKLRFYSESSLGTAPIIENQVKIVYQGSNQPNNSGSENGGTEVNVSIDQNGQTTESSSETVTTTTTTTTSTNANGTTTYTEESTTTTSSGQSTMEEGNVYIDDEMTMTLGSGGCSITDEEYSLLKSKIAEEAFSDDKMLIAKEAAANTCFTVEQISQIALLFDFSEDRLNFLKAAYLNCLNQQDYLQLTAIFTFSADKAELEKFIQSKN